MVAKWVAAIAVLCGVAGLKIERKGLGLRWDDEVVCQPYACTTTLEEGVCSMSNSTSVLVQPCPPLNSCDRDSSLFGTCTPPGEAEGLPGDPCTSDLSCATKVCRNHVCVGRGFQEPCERTEECDRGFFCSTDICWKQLSPGSKGCKNDFDCENGSACRFMSEKNSTCVKYFSAPKYAWVSDCVNYFSRTCESATCLAPGGSGQGVCIDPIQSDPLNAVMPCTAHSDCDSLSGQFTFYGLCQCGGNSQGLKYCAPFPGDPQGRELVGQLRDWYNSTVSHDCHTLKRESEECIAKWDHGGELLSAYFAYQHSVVMLNAELCVVQALFPEFEPEPLVSSASRVSLLAVTLGWLA